MKQDVFDVDASTASGCRRVHMTFSIDVSGLLRSGLEETRVGLAHQAQRAQFTMVAVVSVSEKPKLPPQL